ncbi:unnamed protein product, partial [Mesorhabditis spiculigera]
MKAVSLAFIIFAELVNAESKLNPVNPTASTTAASATSTSPSKNETSSTALDVDAVLAKISKGCITDQEYEDLTGNWFKAKHLGFVTCKDEAELAAAPNLEAYYELKEPQLLELSLDGNSFYERNFAPAIAFWDRRFPEMRAMLSTTRRRTSLCGRSWVDPLSASWPKRNYEKPTISKGHTQDLKVERERNVLFNKFLINGS